MLYDLIGKGDSRRRLIWVPEQSAGTSVKSWSGSAVVPPPNTSVTAPDRTGEDILPFSAPRAKCRRRQRTNRCAEKQAARNKTLNGFERRSVISAYMGCRQGVWSDAAMDETEELQQCRTKRTVKSWSSTSSQDSILQEL